MHGRFTTLQNEQLPEPLIHLDLVIHDDAEHVVLAIQADNVLVFRHIDAFVDVEAFAQNNAALLTEDAIVGTFLHCRTALLFVFEVFETCCLRTIRCIIEYHKILLSLALVLV